jgi:hypothetical protein
MNGWNGLVRRSWLGSLESQRARSTVTGSREKCQQQNKFWPHFPATICLSPAYPHSERHNWGGGLLSQPGRVQSTEAL